MPLALESRVLHRAFFDVIVSVDDALVQLGLSIGTEILPDKYSAHRPALQRFVPLDRGVAWCGHV
jgi:hypothetical protein